MTASENLSIGTIRTSFGVKGWMKLTSHSGEWTHFSDLALVVLEDPRSKRCREYRVEGFQMHHGGGVMKLQGIDSPEEAKTLSRFEILVPRELAAPLQDDEWYLKDLEGLSVLNPEGDRIGRVAGVIESSDDLLEVERDDGSSFLVPFRKEFVAEPDIADRSIVLNADWLADEL